MNITSKDTQTTGNGTLLRNMEYENADGEKFRLVITGKRSHLQGNAKPYFSITATRFHVSKGREKWDAGGCLHEEILDLCPDLADFVAMHLSDDDGAPMHAAANGWHWLSGVDPAMNGFGSKYAPCFGSSSSPAKTPDECRRIAARHLRISEDAVRQLVADVSAAYNKARGPVDFGKARHEFQVAVVEEAEAMNQHMGDAVDHYFHAIHAKALDDFSIFEHDAVYPHTAEMAKFIDAYRSAIYAAGKKVSDKGNSIWKQVMEGTYEPFVNAQRPRWKQEAAAVIEKYNLKIVTE